MTLPHPAWAGLALAGAAVAAAASWHRPSPRRAGGRTWCAGPSPARPGPPDPGAAGWGSRRQLAPLVVRGAPPGRLVLGTLATRGARPGRTVLAGEPAQSVAVVGPTQSGKTTALAVPAILGWEGPVVAASVKTDLVRHTLGWRRS